MIATQHPTRVQLDDHFAATFFFSTSSENFTPPRTTGCSEGLVVGSTERLITHLCPRRCRQKGTKRSHCDRKDMFHAIHFQLLPD